jgi:hypothetical protein
VNRHRTDFVLQPSANWRAGTRREPIVKLIQAMPEKSNRQIAKLVNASPTTVGTKRAEMEATGDVSKLDTSTDTRGRRQPVHKAHGGASFSWMKQT